MQCDCAIIACLLINLNNSPQRKQWNRWFFIDTERKLEFPLLSLRACILLALTLTVVAEILELVPLHNRI